MLKPLGYATGQFGKNHLGDRDEYLPTVHGFDEFFGNLYHLNAEEEPELPDYPKDPGVQEEVRTRAACSTACADGKGGQTSHGHRPADQEAHGDRRRGDHRLARSPGWRSRPRRTSRSSSGTTPRPCTSAPTSPRRTSARAGRTPTAIAWSSTTSRSARCSTSSTSWASPTTPSSCTPPTTARRTTPGRTAPTPRSAARRTPTGKAAGACRASCAGRARSRRARC